MTTIDVQSNTNQVVSLFKSKFTKTKTKTKPKNQKK